MIKSDFTGSVFRILTIERKIPTDGGRKWGCWGLSPINIISSLRERKLTTQCFSQFIIHTHMGKSRDRTEWSVHSHLFTLLLVSSSFASLFIASFEPKIPHGQLPLKKFGIIALTENFNKSDLHPFPSPICKSDSAMPQKIWCFCVCRIFGNTIFFFLRKKKI